MDSINLVPLFNRSPEAKGHTVLVHYSAKGKAALRQGDWKLHMHGKKLKNMEPRYLFNLKTNPNEDVAENYLNNPMQQERVQQMVELFKFCLENPTASL